LIRSRHGWFRLRGQVTSGHAPTAFGPEPGRRQVAARADCGRTASSMLFCGRQGVRPGRRSAQRSRVVIGYAARKRVATKPSHKAAMRTWLGPRSRHTVALHR
jgi:hypothetical protein